MHVAVPGALLETLNIKYLWCAESWPPTDEWKRVVWFSRRCHQLPDDLKQSIKKADVLIGDAASGERKKYCCMDGPEGLDEGDVVRVRKHADGDERVKAIQWTFRRGKARRALEESIQDKVWLEIGTATSLPKAP